MKKIVFLSLFLITPFIYANDVKQEAFLSDWNSTCGSQTVSSAKICVLERNLFSDKGLTQRMISLGFRTTANESVVMTVISPLGTLISEGVEVDVKGLSNKKLPFIFCDQRGCVSQIQLNEEMLAGLRKQKIITMKYQLLNANKAIVNFDISGFETAFSKIKQ
jgi:invasion protein IalB